ncbi:MAG: BamA/TamA family outer membrane protein [Casimicrobiaceae bacterium]
MRLLLCALTLATAAAPTSADAQAPPTAPEPPVATAPHGDDAIRYRVRVVAPSAIESTISAAVDLVRWQDFADMTEDLLDRLAREALPQAREAAATQGYFSAEVELAIDRSKTPADIALTVTAGLPTNVTETTVVVLGPAQLDVPTGTDAIAGVKQGWGLPAGDVFRQSAWTSAKDRAVASLAASPYAAARLVASEAKIDPDARSAELSVEISSGPAFHFGNIEVRGLERYSPELVKSFSTIKPGDLYGERPLDDFIRRLLASGYFASVQASIVPDPELAEGAPVTIAVIEAPARRFELGLGYSTDTQFKASGNYSDVNIDGHGLQFYADARVETKLSSGGIRFVLPPAPGGWLDSFSVGLERTDIENLVTQTAGVKWRRRSINEISTPAFGVGYYVDKQEPMGSPTEDSHALYVDGEYTWRRVDNLLTPQRGYMANLQLGAGVPGASSRTFGRVIGKSAAWWPLSRNTELSARAEAGAVLASSRDGIPSNFLFRTGGDTTVRGYEFDSLGVALGDATVGGRYYAVASGEITRWIGENWGLAAFVDAGDAADSPGDLHMALGYGVGGRFRTPIGPFRIDLAYGQETHSVRVHFSVGLSF